MITSSNLLHNLLKFSELLWKLSYIFNFWYKQPNTNSAILWPENFLKMFFFWWCYHKNKLQNISKYIYIWSIKNSMAIVIPYYFKYLMTSTFSSQILIIDDVTVYDSIIIFSSRKHFKVISHYLFANRQSKKWNHVLSEIVIKTPGHCILSCFVTHCSFMYRTNLLRFF